MSDSRFTLDSNILIYALDRLAGDRHVLAARIIARAQFTDCLLTLQSISEFYAASTRKRLVPPRLALEQATDWLTMFATAAASANAVRASLATAASGRASYWDALLLHTAAEAGCTAILTEDMADASALAGMRIVNPFAGGTLSHAAEALLSTE
jgi:predicted nucleic acid-binding protein